jgi:acyl-CoA thioester hydrolase
MSAEFRSTTKVYLDDTDAQGIVYHANYLKFFERARTDYLDAHGVGLKGAQDRGFRFVVYSVEIKFHRAAVLGDRLEIVSRAGRSSPFRLSFQQKAIRVGDSIVVSTAKVEIVCIGPTGELAEISNELVDLG